MAATDEKACALLLEQGYDLQNTRSRVYVTGSNINYLILKSYYEDLAAERPDLPIRFSPHFGMRTSPVLDRSWMLMVLLDILQVVVTRAAVATTHRDLLASLPALKPL
jgi:hypothetical protein